MSHAELMDTTLDVMDANAPPVSAPDTQPNEASTKSVAPKSKRKFRSIPTIAGQKSDNYVFAPRHSSFFNETQIEIGSEAVQKAFVRSYERCALALFEVDLIIPIIARDEEQATQVWEMTSGAMAKLNKWVADEIGQCKTIIDTNGVMCNGQFSKSQDHTIQVFSPQTSSLLSIFTQMDEMVLLKSRLWMAGFMDNITYRRACFTARVKIIHLAKQFWEIHARSIRALYSARNKAIQAANEARDAAAKTAAQLRLSNTDALINKIEVRESEERESGLVDPLGQQELEVEMGRSLEDAEAETGRKPRKSRAKKTESLEGEE